MVALRGSSTWRVFIIHVLYRALTGASSKRGDWEHATLFFCAGECRLEPRGKRKRRLKQRQELNASMTLLRDVADSQRARRAVFHSHFPYFPRHILCSKHEYTMVSMEGKGTKAESSDESFDFHLDPNRVRTNAEIQLFADVFSISFDEARQVLMKAGKRCAD